MAAIANFLLADVTRCPTLGVGQANELRKQLQERIAADAYNL